MVKIPHKHKKHVHEHVHPKHRVFGFFFFGMAILIFGVLTFQLFLDTEYATRPNAEMTTPTASFDECVAGGYPVLSGETDTCRTPDDHYFVKGMPKLVTDPNTGKADGCIVAGCSMQLCVSMQKPETGISECAFRPEYACYKNTQCEKQSNGLCGWTQNHSLTSCLRSHTAPQ